MRENDRIRQEDRGRLKKLVSKPEKILKKKKQELRTQTG
jgi:hypothetical protein